jgi:hypothetical protein
MMEAIEKAKAGLVAAEYCRCGKLVTFKPAQGGLSLDVLHPQPPCAEFAEFVDKLVELADGQRL